MTGLFANRRMLTVEELLAEREVLVSRRAELSSRDALLRSLGGDRIRESYRISERLDDIRRIMHRFGPTDPTHACEGQVEDGKSPWDGQTLYRPCKSPAKWRFFGWLNGPRDEYLCERHSRPILEPVSWPLWIVSCVLIRSKGCRKGHTFETIDVHTPLDVRDFLGTRDVVVHQMSHCKTCGEPQPEGN